MITVYIVRHGEAEGNAEGRIIGQSDHSLTERGERDAEILGERLRSVKFDKIYSSDLKRARDTANIISEMLDLPFAPESTEKLREIDPGECCGVKIMNFLKEYPASGNDIDFCFPGGESYKEFYRRIADFLKLIKKEHANETVLIVAHEGVIKAIEYHFGYLEFCDHQKIKISHEYVRKFIVDGGSPAE